MGYQRELIAPVDYAAMWLKDSASDREQDFERAYAAYLQDFSSRQVQAIGFGMLWTRKTNIGEAKILSRFEYVPQEIAQPLGPFVIEQVQKQDQFAVISDDELLQSHLSVADNITEERYGVPGGDHPQLIYIRQSTGFMRAHQISSAMAGFISAADGQLTVGQIISAIASLLDTEEDEFRTQFLEELRPLYSEGFLDFF